MRRLFYICIDSSVLSSVILSSDSTDEPSGDPNLDPSIHTSINSSCASSIVLHPTVVLASYSLSPPVPGVQVQVADIVESYFKSQSSYKPSIYDPRTSSGFISRVDLNIFLIICPSDIPGLDPSRGPRNYPSMFFSLFPNQDCGWVYRRFRFRFLLLMEISILVETSSFIYKRTAPNINSTFDGPSFNPSPFLMVCPIDASSSDQIHGSSNYPSLSRGSSLHPNYLNVVHGIPLDLLDINFNESPI